MKITIELDTNDLSPEQLTAVGMLIPSPFDRKPADEPKEAPKTMNRADVRLKEGDIVVLRNGTGPFTVANRADGYYRERYPFDIGPQYLTSDGRFYRHDVTPNSHDAVSVNGIQIED